MSPTLPLAQAEGSDVPPEASSGRGRTMSAEAPRFGWVALVCAALLAGCTTSTSGPAVRPHRALRGHVLKRMSGGEPPGEASHRRRGEPESGPTGSKDGLFGETIGAPSCAGQAVPRGWPDFSSDDARQLLAPFLACVSPAEFVALQRRVDMPRLVEALDAWSAVRLGALGPLRANAAAALTRKRAAFLVEATEKYGLARAEVFALFVLHSAFDDELRELLRLLSRDKQLGETLGKMASVREELRRRGLEVSDFQDRAEKSGDALRGLGRAARDALSSSPTSDGARYLDLSTRREQLPPPYQRALDEVEQAQTDAAFSPEHVAQGGFDHLTFGVPLGFYHLVVGTGHGMSSLSQGRYEQATRELAPAALLVGLYAGGKGLRSIAESTVGGRRFPVPALLDVAALKGLVERLGERLGADGLGEVARYIQASREAALLVCEGGEAAAVALHEARGDVARAQAWLSEAKTQRAGPTPARAGAVTSPGGMTALVDEAAGLTRDVLESKLAGAELESTGPRLSSNVAVLEKQRPSLDAAPPGAQGHPLWGDYVAYFEGRLTELRQGKPVEPPLAWDGYGVMRGQFARGLAFERLMVSLLRADAALPKAQRRWLMDFNEPRIETHVGVAKQGTPGIRFADVLVIERQPPPGQPPRVETFSFKSRDLSQLREKALTVQMIADASAALRYYGETLDILRKTLRLQTEIRRVRLIYEGGGFKPAKVRDLDAVMDQVEKRVLGVEVSVQ